MVQKAVYTAGVPPDIYAFHRYTRNSAFLSHTQALSFRRTLPVKPGDFTPNLENRLHTLYAQ